MGMILLWGDLADSPLAVIHARLQQHGVPVMFIDQNKVLDTEMVLSVATGLHGFLRCGESRHELNMIDAAYVRPYDITQLSQIKMAGPDSAAWRHAIALQETLITWLEIMPGLVLNRFSAMASNGSKPYQATIIRKHGFKTPATLIITSAAEVDTFCRCYGEVIYKSISGVRSIVGRLTEDKKKNLTNIQWSPTQFQQFVRGKDIRVHVVGEQVFCSEIVSEADDYRYAGRTGHGLEIKPCDIPAECKTRCLHLVRDLSLVIAGVDLRLSDDGEWYCFEVNPSPGFTYYQDHTRQDIAGAITQLLIRELDTQVMKGLSPVLQQAVNVSTRMH